jgi:hypothetical protein
MDRPVPAAVDSLTEDMDEIERRDKNICWKIKGIAGQMTYRMFSKYGNPKFADEKLQNDILCSRKTLSNISESKMISQRQNM